MLGYNPDWSRVSRNNGYLIVYCPEHPRAWASGYVYEHIVIKEIEIGRLLQADEVIHHRDRDKTNNSPENLELLSPSAHSKTHARRPTIVGLTCAQCGASIQRRKGQDPNGKGYQAAFCSRACNGKHHGFGKVAQART